MTAKFSNLTMTFFAFSAIFVSLPQVSKADESTRTEIVFRGPAAKWSLEKFKDLLRRSGSDIVFNTKFIAIPVDVDFDTQGLTQTQIKKRLSAEIQANNNCIVIKDNEPDRSAAIQEYQKCLQLANSAEMIVRLNTSQFPTWRMRVERQKKISLMREEMSFESADVDSDTALILTDLADQVQAKAKTYANNNEVVVLRRVLPILK